MSAMATGPSSVLRQALDGHMEIVPWTAEQYLAALNHGFFPEDPGTELIDGFVVRRDRSAVGEDPMSVGDRHRTGVQRLHKLDPQFNRLGCFVQKEDPIAVSGQLPQPDIAIVRGDNDDFADRPPGPADVLCVVEVSDGSLVRDTTIKLQLYAAAGVPVYVVVDLQHDLVLVHRDPDPATGTYPPPLTLGRGDTLALPAGGANTVGIAVDRLL